MYVDGGGDGGGRETPDIKRLYTITVTIRLQGC